VFPGHKLLNFLLQEFSQMLVRAMLKTQIIASLRNQFHQQHKKNSLKMNCSK